MRKFECKGCENHCELTPKERCFCPKLCPFAEGYEPVWHEVKEDSAETAQTTVEPEQLLKLTVEVFDRPHCPEWANYAAVDKDGRAYLYENPPSKDVLNWTAFAGSPYIYTRHVMIGYNFDSCDWENSLIKRPKKQEQLPDWVKAGKWGYDKSREKYFEIVAVRKPFNVEVAYLDDALTTVIGISIFNADCVQAQKRPFNDKEMQALIGKRYETSRFNFLITGYDIQRNAIKVNELWFNSEDLMDEKRFINLPLVEGKPCYKLEHLNEKGEWVE